MHIFVIYVCHNSQNTTVQHQDSRVLYNEVPTRFILLHHEGKTMFSTDGFKLVQIPVLFLPPPSVQLMDPVTCSACTVVPVLIYTDRLNQSINTIVWVGTKRVIKWTAAAATFPGLLFSLCLSLSLEVLGIANVCSFVCFWVLMTLLIHKGFFMLLG